MRIAELKVSVRYDETKTDAESLCGALDTLLETATSTIGILDEYGDPKVHSFEVLADDTPLEAPADPRQWRVRRYWPCDEVCDATFTAATAKDAIQAARAADKIDAEASDWKQKDYSFNDIAGVYYAVHDEKGELIEED